MYYIKFQRQQCTIEIYLGHIEIPAQDCKKKDILPLYNYKQIKIV